MTAPRISDFKNPRDFAAAMIKYAEGERDPTRADADEDREDSIDTTDAPKLSDFQNPREFVRAIEAYAANGYRTDSRKGLAPALAANGARDDAADPTRPADYTPEEWARLQAAGKAAHRAGF